MPDLSRRALLLCLATTLVVCGCMQFTYGGSGDDSTTTQQVDQHDASSWIVTQDFAAAHLDTNEVTHAVVWDARRPGAPTTSEQPYMHYPTWQEFSREDLPYKGLLLDDMNAMAEKLAQRGVREGTTVFVFDDPSRGWGEGGRLVWMLRALGHERAHLIMLPSTSEPSEGFLHTIAQHAAQADELALPLLALTPSDELTATRDEIVADLDRVGDEVVLIDTREAREFAGETPYGEMRGGHVPGAVHVYFKELLSQDGSLLAREQLLGVLKERGITQDKRIVAYCTGGIRSAWLVVVLKELGFKDVQNYAGSMWEWSAQGAESHPLTR